jgi:hypothetical protein
MTRGVSVEMTEEKETKNTVRFAELFDGEADTAVIGTLYVPKHTLNELAKGAALPKGQPLHLRVTIEVVYP